MFARLWHNRDLMYYSWLVTPGKLFLLPYPSLSLYTEFPACLGNCSSTEFNRLLLCSLKKVHPFEVQDL